MRRLLRAAIAVVAVALALELGLTAFMHATGRASGVALHEDYGWRARASIAREGPMWGRDEPARTNRAGWRDREWSRAKPDGATRVAFVGDSFTFGVGADDGERFTDWIRSHEPDVDVLNFGMNGYGTDQQLRVVEREVLGYRPDVVVCVSYLANDLADNAHSVQHRWPKPHYRLDGDQLVHHPPEIGLGVRLRSATYLGEAVALAARRLGLGHGRVRVPCEDPVALYLAIVASMRDAAEDAGARVVVALVHEPLIDEEATASVIEGLAALGVPSIDLRPVFEPAMEAGDALFNPPPVHHWNAAGHALAGGEIVRRLRELEMLPRRPSDD